MPCATCNGWGWVIQIAKDGAAFTQQYRLGVQERVRRGKTVELPTRVAVCTNCGGYGQRTGEEG